MKTYVQTKARIEGSSFTIGQESFEEKLDITVEAVARRAVTYFEAKLEDGSVINLWAPDLLAAVRILSEEGVDSYELTSGAGEVYRVNVKRTRK